MRKKTDTVIVGGGITGLTAAFYLKKQGVDCLVVEEAGRLGGAIQTRKKKGFTYESGPNSGVLGQPEAAALFEDLGDAVELELASPEVNKRYILKKGRWEAMPMGLVQAVRTPLFTLGDKFRILGEPFRRRGRNPEESLAALVKRRMGKSFLDYAVDPFILGVYAGDPQQLVPRYALPKLYRLEQDYGSFIRGAIRKKKEPKSGWEKKATREIFSCKDGLGSLVDGLAGFIGPERCILGAEECRIRPQDGGYLLHYQQDGARHELQAERLVVTTGAHKLPALVPFLNEELMGALTSLRYARVVEVAIGYRSWKGFRPDAFGGLIPFREERDILGILFMSAFLRHRAPKGGALFTVFLGGVRRPEIYELDDAGIRSLLEKEFTSLMGVSEFSPDLLEIMRYEHAIPQYELSSGARFEAAEKAEGLYPGLYLRGNFIGGIGLADRIKQGRRVANEITEP